MKLKQKHKRETSMKQRIEIFGKVNISKNDKEMTKITNMNETKNIIMDLQISKEYTFDDIDEMDQFCNKQNYHNIHNIK